MITINKLGKAYNKEIVLDIEELAIKEGESFGLVGNNGAGKTTMFSLILDLIEANRGEVKLKGEKVARNDAWKSFTGSYLDENYLIDFLTPEEYFEFTGKLHGMSPVDVNNYVVQFEEFFNGEILGKKKYIRDFSKGNQKKIGIVASLIGNPELLVLDEPFANLDPSSQIKLKQLLHDLKKKNKVTMLISSHDLNHVTEVCERIVLLEKGKIIKDIKTTSETLKELEEYFSK